MTPRNPDYPVRLDVEYPQRLSRGLIFVKWLLAFPHYIALTVLALGAYVVLIISWFAVLFTGRYPEGLYNYVVGVLRWGARVTAYVFLLTDQYPPFTFDEVPGYPLHLEVDPPARIARWRPLVNGLLAIPALIAATVIGLLAEIVVFFAWFAILFTGRFPDGMFSIVVVYLRWNVRTLTFAYWMQERYPPFVWA
jgi:hypothetical protein